jgi:hypothetical protein
LNCRSLALWALGYPDAALADTEQALSEARDTGLAGALMQAMSNICLTQVISGNYTIAHAQSDELIALAEEKGSATWKANGMLRRAGVLALTGKASDAVRIFTLVIPVWRSTGSRIFDISVQLDHAVFTLADRDVPAVDSLVDQRLVGPPTVRRSRSSTASHCALRSRESNQVGRHPCGGPAENNHPLESAAFARRTPIADTDESFRQTTAY